MDSFEEICLIVGLDHGTGTGALVAVLKIFEVQNQNKQLKKNKLYDHFIFGKWKGALYKAQSNRMGLLREEWNISQVSS